MQSTVGSPALSLLSAGEPGCVIAAFSRAVYVRLGAPARLVAIVPLDAPSGPLHLRVSRMPPAGVADLAEARDGVLTVGSTPLPIPAEAWQPPPAPDLPEARPAAARVLREALGDYRVLDLAGRPWDVMRSLRAEGLRRTLAGLAGRGTGLTPAGDDCAAGILLATAMLGAQGMTTWPPHELVDLASRHDSHEISVAFLTAAAQGQSIEPIHALIAACARSDLEGARAQVRRLERIGHSSGHDLAYGVLVGLGLADVIADDWLGERERMSSRTHRAE